MYHSLLQLQLAHDVPRENAQRPGSAAAPAVRRAPGSGPPVARPKFLSGRIGLSRRQEV